MAKRAQPTRTLAEVVRQEIKRRRAELELTQEQLCAKAGLSLDAVSRIESGSRVPRLDTLERLATALELSVGELLGDAPAPAATQAPQLRRLVALLESQSAETQALVVALAKAVVKASPKL
jgi:transcriptional regulator with XRE-family HTH domain